MNYTPFLLSVFGLLGILIHNVLKLNTINKEKLGEYTLGEYIKIEKYSIIASILIVAVAVLGVQEIKQLKDVQKYLGLAFVAFGYMGQSILIKYMSKIEKM